MKAEDRAREEATKFQQRLTAEATAEPGKVWWASISFPAELADLLLAFAGEARLDEHNRFFSVMHADRIAALEQQQAKVAGAETEETR